MPDSSSESESSLDDRPFEWPVGIRAVAFDMDGLMINTEDMYEEIGELIMQRRGKRMKAEIRREMMGRPAQQAWEFLIEAESLSDGWQTLQAETVELFHSILPERLQPLPGLLELLNDLDQLGIPRCVATSSHRDFAERALELCSVLDRIDFIVTADDVNCGKPAPDIYLYSAKLLGVSPIEMLVLEDSGNGSAAAAASQACLVAIPSRHTADHTFPERAFFAHSLADPRIRELLLRSTNA